MMACPDFTARMSPYLDEALSLASERAALEAHLAECDECRRHLASLRALKHAIARLASREEPTGALRAHVEKRRLEAPRHSRRLVVAGSMTALLAIALIGRAVVRHDGHGRRLAADLVADHLKSVPEVRPAEIASSDPVAIAGFFTGHVPFPVVVPHLPGAELLGARLCRIDGRRVELLFYRRAALTLSLFVTDDPSVTTDCWEENDHHVCSRRHDTTNVLLVGALPVDELRTLLDASVISSPRHLAHEEPRADAPR